MLKKVNSSYLRKVSPLLLDFGFVLLFGLFSELLSLVSSEIAGVKYNINLREIPLLVSLVYIRKPLLVGLYAIVLPSYSFLIQNIPFDIGLVVTHVPALLVLWYVFHRVRLNFSNLSKLAMLIFFSIGCYYYAIVFPLVAGWKTLVDGISIRTDEYYLLLLKASLFEVIPTALIASLFLVQESMRNRLKEINKNLEQLVSQRTLQLSQANEKLHVVNDELITVNEEMRTLNDNLEKLVAERTEKINNQLDQLIRYAHLNSHEVRGPLARILGLINLMNLDHTIDRTEYMHLLGIAAEELDKVIKKMNRLLEAEIG